jgi:hypothetical protein
VIIRALNLDMADLSRMKRLDEFPIYNNRYVRIVNFT